MSAIPIASLTRWCSDVPSNVPNGLGEGGSSRPRWRSRWRPRCLTGHLGLSVSHLFMEAGQPQVSFRGILVHAARASCAGPSLAVEMAARWRRCSLCTHSSPHRHHRICGTGVAQGRVKQSTELGRSGRWSVAAVLLTCVLLAALAVATYARGSSTYPAEHVTFHT